jgi:hypothetical protein
MDVKVPVTAMFIIVTAMQTLDQPQTERSATQGRRGVH